MTNKGIFLGLNFSSNTAQRDEDNNSVKIFMRGRPVTFYVPEKKYDLQNYDLSKVQPAPNRKLKMDWVSLKLIEIAFDEQFSVSFDSDLVEKLKSSRIIAAGDFLNVT